MTVLSKEGRSLCYKLLKWTEVYECSPRQTDGYKNQVIIIVYKA